MVDIDKLRALKSKAGNAKVMLTANGHYEKYLTQEEVAAFEFVVNSGIQMPSLLDELTALRAASIAFRDDLLSRAEWDDDAVKVVCAGNSAWRNFNEAIDN
jgi:hypothetical protein